MERVSYSVIAVVKRYKYRVALVAGLCFVLFFLWFNWTPMWVNGLHGKIGNSWFYHSVDDESPVHINSIDDIYFTMGWGSGLHGYETIAIDANGKVQFLFHDFGAREPHWRLLAFRVPKETLQKLKSLLMDVEYFSLKSQYHAYVHDGTQWFVKVSCREGKKSVYCNNHFPQEIVKISDFLQSTFLGDRASHSISERVDCRETWNKLTGGSESFK